MVSTKQLALSDATDWLGYWHPLAEQLGSADSLVTLGSVSDWLSLRPVTNVASLGVFLEEYKSRMLVECELPTILRAYEHVVRNELRELIALDNQMADDVLLRNFAEASRRVGQGQLQRLRPLRDQRIVQRYLQAVEAGQANGWHTLVYGLTLSIYSLPLRQGLLGYAHQTTRGFIYAAARTLEMSERACRRLFDCVAEDLPQAVEALIRNSERSVQVQPTTT